MVRNIIISVKRSLIKCGFWISLICLILYIWLTFRNNTNVNEEIHSIVASFSTDTTTTADFISTTEEIPTNELTSEKIVHRVSFKYMHLPPNVCAKNGEPMEAFLVILVKSSVINIGHREAIRLTWGKFNNTNIQLVFLLGYSELIKKYIDMEFSLYKDIVQQDFVDDYFNNTLKTIMAFDWLVTYCPKAKFVYFVDDDYFVNLPQIISYLETNVKRKRKLLIAGYKNVGAIVRRNSNSKWFVSQKDYRNKTWPPYLSGGSIVMDMTVAKLINEKLPYIIPIYIDDVYLGIVAQVLHIELLNERKFSVHYSSKQLDKLFSAHNYGSPHKLIAEWKRVRCQHKMLFQALYSLYDC